MQYDHPIRSSRNKFLLGWFVLASAIAHLLFITLPDNKAEQTAHVNLSTPLQITVISFRPAAKSVSPLKKQAVQIAKATALPEKNHEILPDDNSKAKLIKEAPTTTREVISVKYVPLNHLRQQLKQAIKARFTYPRMARRMGWQGLVGISLRIEDDGSLNQVHVAHSSGHKVLDENARKTIQKIGRIQVASNLSIKASDTEIEVLYRLTD